MLFNLSFLLSNHFSFQGQSAKNFSTVYRSLISTADYFPHWKADNFYFKKSVEDESLLSFFTIYFGYMFIHSY